MNDNILKYITIFGIGFIPPHLTILYFINSNSQESVNLLIVKFILLILCIFFIQLILFFLFGKKKLIFFSLSFYIFFFYSSLYDFIISFNSSLEIIGELTFVTLIIAIFVTFYYTKIKIVELFLSIFFISSFLIIFNTIFIFSFNEQKLINENVNNKHLNEINKAVSTTFKKNIYFLIPDQMIDFKFKNKKINFDNKKFENELNKHNIEYFENVIPSYNITNISISSILELDYPVNDNDVVKSYDNFYPFILYDKKYESLNLLSILKNINYNFKWIAPNNWYSCTHSINSLQYCLNNTYSYLKSVKIYYHVYFMQTPYSIGYNKIKYWMFDTKGHSTNKFEKWIRENFFDDVWFDDNLCLDIDSICKVIAFLEKDKIKKNENYFFLIHHFNPHPPYVFDKHCNIDKNSDYEQSYYCTFLKILRLNEMIVKKDPDAILIIQADHGLYENEIVNNVFTGIKKNNCKKKPTQDPSSINLTLYALNCILDLKPIYLENQYFLYNNNQSDKEHRKINKININ